MSFEGSKVMGVGGGIHDDAVDVTYSTKPDRPAMASMALNQGAVATTTTTSTAQYNLGEGAGESSSLGVDLGATIGNTINLGSSSAGMD